VSNFKEYCYYQIGIRDVTQSKFTGILVSGYKANDQFQLLITDVLILTLASVCQLAVNRLVPNISG